MFSCSSISNTWLYSGKVTGVGVFLLSRQLLSLSEVGTFCVEDNPVKDMLDMVFKDLKDFLFSDEERRSSAECEDTILLSAGPLSSSSLWTCLLYATLKAVPTMLLSSSAWQGVRSLNVWHSC